MDLEIQQTVASITLDRSAASIERIATCRHTRRLFLLHQNGCISARSTDTSAALGAPFEFDGQSDALRLSKAAQIQAMALHPTSERDLALVSTDGRLFFYTFRPGAGSVSPSASPSAPISPPSSGSPPPQLGSFFLRTLTEHCTAPTTALRASPPSSVRYPALALGGANGAIHLADLSTNHIQRRYAVHLAAVREIQWIGDHHLVSFSSEENTPTCHRTSVCRLDLRSGNIVRLRERNDDPSGIACIRVSCLEQYLLVVFREHPMELWDVQRGQHLKTMPTSFPVVASLDWAPPSSSRRARAAQLTSAFSTPLSTPGPAAAGSPAAMLGTPGGPQPASQAIKEHFAIATPDGQLFHFTVEGSIVRNGAKLPSEPVLQLITAMAWRDDFMVLGDAAGTLHIWNIKVGYIKCFCCCDD